MEQNYATVPSQDCLQRLDRYFFPQYKLWKDYDNPRGGRKESVVKDDVVDEVFLTNVYF